MEEQGENQNDKRAADRVKDKAKQSAKKRENRIIRKILTKVAGAIIFLLFNGWPAILAICVVFGLFDFATEMTSGQNTPNTINTQLGVEDLAELVQIKEDGQGGYYLDFVDNFDSKVDEIVENINSTTGSYNLPKDSDFLKTLIKAEVITQFPDLGGKPQGDGFQGSIKIRRVSPDKDIKEMENTGVNDAVPIQEEVAYDTNVVGSNEETIKSWEAGKKLLIKASAKVYKQTESELNPGSDTGNWEEVLDETGRVKTIPRGTEVEYTGTYKNNENPLSGQVITYVEVKYEDENIYVRANYLSEKQDETEQQSSNEARTTSVAKVTSRAGENGKEEVGGDKDSYVVAIAAGHNNTDDTGARSGDLVEEDLTIEVAEKVQELIEDRFSNITVIQTGSTSDNRGGIGAGERTELAKNANPDLCIQIHFNSSTSADGNGVEVIYKQGDGISQQLAEILTDSISSAMGLENRGAGPDNEKCESSLGIIENAATSGFPSVVTEGGFLSGDVDANVIRNGGVDKYAEGIVNGIKKYLEASHEGYSSTEVTNQEASEGIRSVVKNLKYVPEDTMEQYIAEGNTEALNVFTLDEERNLITATWSSTGDAIQIKKNSAVNLKTSLQKYVMPYEYLLFFYIDTYDYEDFSKDLADTIIKDTEIVITVEDNVTTTQTTTTVLERRVDDDPNKEHENLEVGSSTEVTENCSTSVGITYINTWFVRAYQENSYSSEILNMGDDETKVLNIKGRVDDTSTESLTDEILVEEGSYEVQVPKNSSQTSNTSDFETVTYNYSIYNRNRINTRTISNTYESGDLKTEGRESVFVNLYKQHKMYKNIRTDYIFRLIENNEKTANLLDLTKYLIYKATNINLGVIEFDFSEYGLSQFSTINGGFYGDTVQEKVWWALIDAGYSKEAAAGVLGNIQAESGFREEAIEGGSGIGFGLCQWSFGRRTALESYAASKGVEPSDVNTQIEFLIAELTPGGGANGYASYQLVTYHGYSASDWANASTPEDAAIAFCWSFERPGIPRMDVRTEAARRYYEQFKDLEKPTTDDRIGQINLSSENAAKMQQMLNEAIRIADDDRYTYSQANRYGEFQYDCSSLIARLYKQYFNFDAPSTTRGYGSAYYVGADGQVDLQPGDVLWRPGHVEMYIGNGLQVGAHTDGVPAADQISVESYVRGYFTKVYRFITN